MALTTVVIPCLRLSNKRSGINLTVVQDDVALTRIVTSVEVWNNESKAFQVLLSVGARQRAKVMTPGEQATLDLTAQTLDYDNLRVSVRY